MPRYEYECDRCGPFEVEQQMRDDPLTEHDCGAPARRIISSTSFSLRGGGWYADGYGAKRASKTGNESKASEKKTSSGDSKAA